MIKVLMKYAFFFLVILSCQAQKKGGAGYGTITGIVGIFEGNCMPSPGVAPCKPRPISTTVFITSQAMVFEWSLLVDSVVSDSNGRFTLETAAGAYSLFLRDGKKINCPGSLCDPDCYCTPVTISADSVYLINLNLDHASW